MTNLRNYLSDRQVRPILFRLYSMENKISSLKWMDDCIQFLQITQIMSGYLKCMLLPLC